MLSVPPAKAVPFDMLYTGRPFRLTDPKMPNDPSQAGMKLGRATYRIIGFMNGAATEEDTATYVKFTVRNSDAVMRPSKPPVPSIRPVAGQGDETGAGPPDRPVGEVIADFVKLEAVMGKAKWLKAKKLARLA